MPESGESFCYNKGCGQKFAVTTNKEGSCKFHPGEPVFHDAYKGWGCCNKKVTDFTEFLNIPGCTLGAHNPTKPPEPEKKDIVEMGSLADAASAVCVSSAPKAAVLPTAASRDLGTETMTALKKTVNSALKAALAKAEEEAKEKKSDELAPSEPAVVEPGTPCKNSACGRTFDPSGGTPENCWHHPGSAIFHEGMKFWSCCNRKTSDFDAFLSQPGCTRGEHKWVADEAAEDAALECRDDFHQTGTHVVLTYYLKRSHPTLTLIEANPVALRVALCSIDGPKKEMDIQLWGAIDVSESSVNQTPSKVEVKLRKADPVAWAGLHYKAPVEAS